MAIKVLVSDPLSKEGIDILKQNGFKVDEVSKLSEKELVKKIKGYDALIIRSGTTVTEKIINASDNLKVIGRAGVGLDNVDVTAASKKGIIVMNAPAGNTISTAEHAFSLMLSLSRNIPQANYSVKQGKWDRKKYMGVELYGKTLGIIGLGRIGTEFAKRALSFGMKVMAADPFLSEEKAKSINVEPVDLGTLFANADFITIHTPLTKETGHLIDDKAFQKMKKGVRIVNAARGGIVDEKALAKHLKSGKVAGAALDVYETKAKPPLDSPVVALEEVITTPHLGASTEEAQVNVAVDIARSVSDALTGKGFRTGRLAHARRPSKQKRDTPAIGHGFAKAPFAHDRMAIGYLHESHFERLLHFFGQNQLVHAHFALADSYTTSPFSPPAFVNLQRSHALCG